MQAIQSPKNVAVWRRSLGIPRAVSAGIAAILGVLLTAIGIYSLLNAQKSISRASIAVDASDQLMESLLDIETGGRGFVVTGGEDYLQPYIAARAQLASRRAHFQEAVTRLGRTQWGEQMAPAVERVVTIVGEMVDLRSSQGFEAAQKQFALREGKKAMDQVRALVSVTRSHAEGIISDGERVISVRAPLFVGAGLLSLLGGIVSIGLIASRARREIEIRDKLFREVLDRSPIGVAIFSRDGDIVQSNPSFSAIVPGADGAHRIADLSDAYLRSALPMLDAAHHGFSPTAESRPVASSEVEIDGRTRHLETLFFPLTSERGAPSRAAVLVSDVTLQRMFERELEQAREDAERSNRAKSSFLANMSHELRTPLTAVLGYCELLAEEMEETADKSALDDLRKIEANARHLLSLINDVLDLDRKSVV